MRSVMGRGVAICAAISMIGLLGACESTGSRSSRSGSSDELTQAIADAERAAQEAREAARAARASRGSGGGSGYSYSPDVGDDMIVAGMAFPTGDTATSALQLHEVMPKEVARGQTFESQYHVTNVTNGTLQNVIVVAQGYQNLDVKSSSPRAQEVDDGLLWSLGEIGPRETKVIRVNGSADEVGLTGNCISVSYNNLLCAATNVVEPGLDVVKTATRRSLVCDEIELKYVVCNTGTGVARNVMLRDDLPRGMTTVDGKRRLETEIGDLTAGECVEVVVTAKATETGEWSSGAVASGSGGLTAESEKPVTVVVQPVLEITSDCPEDRYIGRNVAFEYTVRNTGDGVAENTVLTATVPAGSELGAITNNGQAAGGRITWNLGSLAPGAERTVNFRVKGSEPMTLTSRGSVNAECASAVEAHCTSRVIGIPAVLLEVIDLNDPVEVGEQTTYVITVTNQGTAPDTNIQVVCELPNQETFVGTDGPTTSRHANGTVTFAPVRSLAPGAQAQWRLTVRANDVGDVRFSVRMTTDELTSPVIETEATNLYR